MFDYFFWFAQPSTILTQEDKILGIIFLAMLVVAIVFRVLAWFAKNPVNKELYKKFWSLFFWTGLSGVIWLGIRYENTQLFGRRYWAGLTLLVGVIWLGFIVKYLAFNYRSKKMEYNKESIKNKYLPASTRRRV
jgi:hypothetical protein